MFLPLGADTGVGLGDLKFGGDNKAEISRLR